MKYTVISGTGIEAKVERTYENTEEMNLPEIVRKISDMKTAIEEKIVSYNHFIDTLQAIVDAGVSLPVPKKIGLAEVK